MSLVKTTMTTPAGRVFWDLSAATLVTRPAPKLSAPIWPRWRLPASQEEGNPQEVLRHMLATTPAVATRSGQKIWMDHFSLSEFHRFIDGEWHLGRLETLHRMLCGDKGPENVTVTDNAGGVYPHSAFTFAKLGSRVIVKESSKLLLRTQGRALHRLFNHEAYSRISYIADLDLINQPSPVDIAYWCNPSPTMISWLRKQNALSVSHGIYTLHEYLGRDVVAGGFLVAQTTDQSMLYDDTRWRRILHIRINSPHSMSETVIPDDFTAWVLSLQIYERLSPH